MEDLTETKEAQTIGEMLRNARIKQNLTIDDVADELCIRKFYLTAIENMDFENMPPMPYCLGFVRSYAKLLGMNSDRIVFSYRQVITGEEEPVTQHENNHSEASAPHVKHFVLGVLGLILLAVAWSVLPTTSKFDDVSEESAAVVPEPVIVADEEEQPADEIKDEIKDESENKISDEDEAAKEQVKEEDTKETAIEQEKKEDKKADAVALPKMRIVLTGPSWLELRQGNKILLNNVYNKGYKYEMPSGKGLVISVGRPRNVQFFLDDKPIQVASNIKRKNISLDSYFKTQD